MFLFLGSTSVALHDLQLSINVSSASPLSTVLNDLFLLFLIPDWLLPAKDRFEQLVVWAACSTQPLSCRSKIRAFALQGCKLSSLLWTLFNLSSGDLYMCQMEKLRDSCHSLFPSPLLLSHLWRGGGEGGSRARFSVHPWEIPSGPGPARPTCFERLYGRTEGRPGRRSHTGTVWCKKDTKKVHTLTHTWNCRLESVVCHLFLNILLINSFLHVPDLCAFKIYNT